VFFPNAIQVISKIFVTYLYSALKLIGYADEHRRSPKPEQKTNEKSNFGQSRG
jgi:hypothetical protein